MDPEKMILHRLYRKHCTLINCEFVKDLSQLGRDLKDVIIIDNSPDCYTLQPCNGIPILTWTNDKSDKELDRLSSILEMMHKVDDVRDYLREVVRDNELDYLQAVRLLKGEITLDEIQRNPSAYWSSPRKKMLKALASPERSRSQVKLNGTVDKFKDQKKISLGVKFVPIAVQKEPLKLKHGGDSCAVLPRAVDETPKKQLAKPPVTPIVTEYKPIVKLEPIKLLTTPDTSELRNAHSVKRDSSCSKFTSAEKLHYKAENSPNQKLPPRPSYHSGLRATPQKVERISVETNKYIPKTSYSSNKALNLSYDYKPVSQISTYKAPACPSYGKYIKVPQPPLEPYSTQKATRSYSSSTPQSQHYRSITGDAKPYGAYSVFSYKRNSNGHYK
jgi:hypothetical protein